MFPLSKVLQNILKLSELTSCFFSMDPKLYQAAMNGDLVYLQTLDEFSSNLHSQKTLSNNDTILHIAAEFHQTEFAIAAVQHCPSLLGEANTVGDTALHVAAGENLVGLVGFFIDCVRSMDVGNGVSRHIKELVRAVNLEKDTALHCAARRANYRCVELLVKADPEVCSFVNDANESPLYVSVASGFWIMPEILINCASSSVSYKGPNGLTALHPTIFFTNYAPEKIELLMRWKREMIREKDNLGLTLLHYAALCGNSKVTMLILQYDSSAVYLPNNNGETAFHLAAYCGNVDILEAIVNRCPDCWNLVDNKGRTALHTAVLGKNRIAVEFILGRAPMFAIARLINKQDKDGNTPLHLAAFFKLYAMIEFLANSEKVSLKIANKEFLTPLEVYNQHNEEGLSAEKTRWNLKDSKNTMSMQRFATTQLQKMNEEPAITTETSTTTTNESTKFALQNALEVNLLVATLVATVTFTAGFTMPGGFANNKEDGEGLAILTNKIAFELFIVFNTLAFCCSVFAVLLQFHTSLADYRLRIRYMGIAAHSTTVAIVAMVLAFSSGTYVVLTKSTGLAFTPYVICGCFVIFYFAIPLADPGVKGFPCLNWLQSFVRGIVIRHVRCE